MNLHAARDSEALLFVHGPRWEYRRDKDDPHTSRYIPSRILPLVRPDKDLVVMPGNSAEVREYADFCMESLGIKSWQIHFTSGSSYQVQTDARIELLSTLKDATQRGVWLLMPYSVSPSITRLSRELGVPVVGDSSTWVKRFGTKAILHPSAIPALRPSYLPYLPEHCAGIVRARGYLASNCEELEAAFALLREQGVIDVLIKPADGSTGEGIIAMQTRHGPNGYAFPLGPVLVEEKLVIDVDDEGRQIAPSIQYVRGSLGAPTDQLIDGLSHCGNRFPSTRHAAFSRAFSGMAADVIRWSRPKGLGGFDALSVGGKPILVDVNAGRWTGAHPALFFRSLYAPERAALSFKAKPKGSVWDVWKMLTSRNIAFVPGKSTSGVYPLCHLSGMWAMYVAIGDDACHAEKLAHEARNM